MNDVQTTDAEEQQAFADAPAQHLFPESEPNMGEFPGVQDSRYILQDLDPQWKRAYKLQRDEKGVYGVETLVPKGQWDQGGANALMNQRYADGSRVFTLLKPARVLYQGDLAGKYECFIGECTKRMATGQQLVEHARAVHPQESVAFKRELDDIERMAVQNNQRFARVRDKIIADIAGTETVADTFRCPEEGCVRFFDTQQGLAVHRAKEHKNG